MDVRCYIRVVTKEQLVKTSAKKELVQKTKQARKK